MRNLNDKIKLNAIAIAVITLVGSVSAQADDQEAEMLKQPQNTVEIGVINTSNDSAKFGEYSGLNNSGTKLNGSMNIRGGDGYSKNENGEVRRWSIYGNDLGLTSRTFRGDISDQGDWRVGLIYDELQHNLTDSYKTPYSGAMGGGTFTLPNSNYDSYLPSNSYSIGNYLNKVDVWSKRTNTGLSAGKELDSRWGMSFDYNHLKQDGAKLMGFASMKNTSTTSPLGEYIAILPNPTLSSTDTMSLAFNYKDTESFFAATYFGSFYRNGINGINFDTWDGPNKQTQTMSADPSNDFNQLSISGGHKISSQTKFVGGLSYGRNTQNSSYVNDGYANTGTLPASSMNGVVNNTHADAKIINQATKNLTLSVGFKFDERDNKSPSNIYTFNAVDGNTANGATYPNTPLSTKKTQFDISADQKLDKSRNIHFAFNHSDVKRWCDNYAVNSKYSAGTNCVVGTETVDNKFDTIYRSNLADGLSYKVGYSYLNRKSDFDMNARAAMIGSLGVFSFPATLSSTSSSNPSAGASVNSGLNAGDIPGFHPYFDSSKTQQLLKTSVNWDANDNWNLSVTGRAGWDNYDTTYGVQQGHVSSLTLDSLYNYSENGQFISYITQQNRSRDMTNYAYSNSSSTIVQGTWFNQLNETDLTLGLGFKQAGLMQGKFELSSDLSYSLATSSYATQPGTYAFTKPVGVSCTDANRMTCGAVPDVRNTVKMLKVSGIYTFDKSTKFAIRLTHASLKSDDYIYNPYAIDVLNAGSKFLPTGQQPGNFSITTIAASFIHNF
jgi:MtrB/PioB family decaheme-associated outer membrane protein